MLMAVKPFARVPDAVQRFFGGAPQSRAPVSLRGMDPGSAAHRKSAAPHPGHAVAGAVLPMSPTKEQSEAPCRDIGKW
jgi:hypothetical protein